MQRTAVLARELGHSVLLVNHRGCGEGRDLAQRPYHSGRGEDLSDAIAFARQMLPNKRVIAIGFSLGANALLLLLSKIRGTELPDAAIVVNAPIDLQTASGQLRRGFNRIYDFHFVQSCRKDIDYKKSRGFLKQEIKIPFWAYLEQVDDLYTAPESGFKDKEDYYAHCSTYHRLQNIQTPTVIITSKDDPFIPWQPYLGALGNPHIHLQIEDYGGHLGYLTKRSKARTSQRWLDYAINEILQTLERRLAVSVPVGISERSILSGETL